MLLAAMLLRGSIEGLFDVPMFTLRQRRTDPAWLGRAFSVSMSLNFIGYPIGSAIGGALAAIGPETALAVGLAFSAVEVVALRLFVPRA